MTQTKNTKKALLASLLSMLLCVAMLIGSTFAWFTDSVSSAKNKIVAGNLDLVLEMFDPETGNWLDAEDKPIGFIRENQIVSADKILFEPGCTFKTPKLRVRNEGSVASYFILKIDGITGDEELMDALEFETIVSGKNAIIYEGGVEKDYSTNKDQRYYPIMGTKDGNVAFDWSLVGKDQESPHTHHKDTSPDMEIQIHMKEEAGNEFQGKSIDGLIVSVVGTQASYEFDSFGKDYDAGSEELLPTTTSKGLNEALEAAKAGEHVDLQLGGDIVFTERDGVELENGADVSINGEGKTLTVEHTAFNNNDGLEGINEGTLNFSNIVFEGAKADALDGQFATVLGFDSNVTLVFENCTFKNLYAAVCCNPNKADNKSTIVFKNCKFENTNYGVSIDPETETDTYEVTFEGCSGLATDKEFEKF